MHEDFKDQQVNLRKELGYLISNQEIITNKRVSSSSYLNKDGVFFPKAFPQAFMESKSQNQGESSFPQALMEVARRSNSKGGGLE